MKKFVLQQAEVKVEKLVPGGQALGEITAGTEQGKKIFLWNALPGEVVTEFLPTKIKSHYVEAIAQKIAEPSPNRATPRDECFLSTSPWQILDYDYELAQKAAIVRECFRQNGVDLAERGVEKLTVKTDGREYFYRNKMEYALFYDHETRKIRPAFHARGLHRKVPVAGSSLERPEIWARAQKIIVDLNVRGAEARQFQSLMLRCNQTGEVAGGLFENHRPHPVFSQLRDRILGETYAYSPNGFFQVNLPVYELALLDMRRILREKVKISGKVLDFFAGAGTIGLSVAREAELTLVECDRNAYAELAVNARTHAHARAVLARAEEVTDFITPETAVILDPPRAGCDAKLTAKLAEVKPGLILYLSCNPITQARDVAQLLVAGDYQIAAMQVYNFFPHTPHVENLTALVRE